MNMNSPAAPTRSAAPPATFFLERPFPPRSAWSAMRLAPGLDRLPPPIVTIPRPANLAPAPADGAGRAAVWIIRRVFGGFRHLTRGGGKRHRARPRLPLRDPLAGTRTGRGNPRPGPPLRTRRPRDDASAAAARDRGD